MSDDYFFFNEVGDNAIFFNQILLIKRVKRNAFFDRFVIVAIHADNQFTNFTNGIAVAFAGGDIISKTVFFDKIFKQWCTAVFYKNAKATGIGYSYIQNIIIYIGYFRWFQVVLSYEMFKGSFLIQKTVINGIE